MIYNTVDGVVTEIEIDSCDEIDSKVKRRNQSAYITIDKIWRINMTFEN